MAGPGCGWLVRQLRRLHGPPRHRPLAARPLRRFGGSAAAGQGALSPARDPAPAALRHAGRSGRRDRGRDLGRGEPGLPAPLPALPARHPEPRHPGRGDRRALDPALFKSCFACWVEGLRAAEPDIIAVDGKTSRRTHARGQGRGPLHLVSARATRQRLVLGQEAVTGKSNEITAIPLLLERLALPGAPGTIDALRPPAGVATALLRPGGHNPPA